MSKLFTKEGEQMIANLKQKIQTKLQPKEIKFTCRKCGNIWYATKKDLNESQKKKRDINIAKMDNFGFHTVKTHTENQAKISQMQMAYIDYRRCPNCGSRDVET